MSNKSFVTIIRNRYQLTVPEAARKRLPWLIPDSPASVLISGGKLVIEPYRVKEVKTDWKKTWSLLNKMSAKKSLVPLSEFVINDRLSSGR